MQSGDRADRGETGREQPAYVPDALGPVERPELLTQSAEPDVLPVLREFEEFVQELRHQRQHDRGLFLVGGFRGIGALGPL